jgi:DNA-directed RNA polymerase specialized sigma24 family protein
MDTKYAEAIMILQSDIEEAILHAEDAGLKPNEIAEELRRQAKEVETD